jgi:hypothetical protein
MTILTPSVYLLLASLAVLPPEPSGESADEPCWQDRILQPDNLRVSLLLGMSGGVPSGGAKVSLFGLKWDGFYWITAEAGFDTLMFMNNDLFAGTEAGYLLVRGCNYFSIGVMAGVGEVTEYHEDDGRDASKGARGFSLRPIMRFRHYWRGFDLEVSLELPVVFGPAPCEWGCETRHVSYPVLGIGVGL